MDVRYYRDPESGLPHIYDHGVPEAEVEWILARPSEDEACADNLHQALGKRNSSMWDRIPILSIRGK